MAVSTRLWTAIFALWTHRFTTGGRWPCDRRIGIWIPREMCVLSETGCRCDGGRPTLCRISQSSWWPVEWTNSDDDGRTGGCQASVVTIIQSASNGGGGWRWGNPGKRMAFGSSSPQQAICLIPFRRRQAGRKKNAAKPVGCGFGTGWRAGRTCQRIDRCAGSRRTRSVLRWVQILDVIDWPGRWISISPVCGLQWNQHKVRMAEGDVMRRVGGHPYGRSVNGPIGNLTRCQDRCSVH
jgi:hypothetical protein